MPPPLEAILPRVVQIAAQAGARIMEIYQSGKLNTVWKGVKDPLTAADLAANELITRELTALYPDWPVLSEETVPPPFEERKKWKCFWLVDPLDGTRGFIEKTDEFSVNIALVDGHSPVLGVVYGPAKKRMYGAAKGTGVFVWDEAFNKTPIQAARYKSGEKIRIVASRLHYKGESEGLSGKIPPFETIQIGSALKFGCVADGSAHIYPRFGRTMEWDAAAGHALVLEAGGEVIDFEGQPVVYNKADLANPPFIAQAFDLPGLRQFLVSQKSSA